MFDLIFIILEIGRRSIVERKSPALFPSPWRRVDLGLKAFWRTRLKEERDAYQKSIPSEFFQVVDMPSNNEIDKNLPSYGELLKLLNSMYGKSPYHTRYFLRGAKTIPNVWLLLTVTSIIYDLALPQCLDYGRNTEL